MWDQFCVFIAVKNAKWTATNGGIIFYTFLRKIQIWELRPLKVRIITSLSDGICLCWSEQRPSSMTLKLTILCISYTYAVAQLNRWRRSHRHYTSQRKFGHDQFIIQRSEASGRCLSNRFRLILHDVQLLKKSNWFGYFVWHVIINNLAASKDLIEG